MSEDGTAVLESTEEETTPGGLFTKNQFEDLKKGIDKIAKSRDGSIPRETAPEASEPSEAPTEPEEAKPADEPPHAPEPAAPEAEPIEPEVSEPAEPAPEKADEESPVAGFDDTLLARAEQMGFTKKAAESFGTPDKLETALTVLDQRLIGMAKPKAVTSPETPAPQATVPEVPVVQAPPVQPAADSFVIDLDPDEHSPEIVEQFKKLNSHYEARALQFEQAFVGLVSAMQSGKQRSDLQVVNQAIEGLNGDMKDLMTTEIRAQIHPTAVALASALSQSGLPVPSIPELVGRAARSLMSEQLLKNEHKRATDEISEKLDKRALQRTARPVQHHSVEPGLTKQERKAQSVKDIGAYMIERGMR